MKTMNSKEPVSYFHGAWFPGNNSSIAISLAEIDNPTKGMEYAIFMNMRLDSSGSVNSPQPVTNQPRISMKFTAQQSLSFASAIEACANGNPNLAESFSIETDPSKSEYGGIKKILRVGGKLDALNRPMVAISFDQGGQQFQYVCDPMTALSMAIHLKYIAQTIYEIERRQVVRG